MKKDYNSPFLYLKSIPTKSVITLAIFVALFLLGTTSFAQTNAALTGTATQISTNGSGVASIAIDGNTAGVNNTSTAHTAGSTTTDWWQVDLGSTQYINTINIFNRDDNGQNRLGNVYVMVSNTPFTGNLAADRAQAVFEFQLPAAVTGDEIVHLGSCGRYVRLRKSGTNPGGNFINIAEVQVIVRDNANADGDAYPDFCDLDDDNDGILDTDEGAFCAGTATVAYVTRILGFNTDATTQNNPVLTPGSGTFSDYSLGSPSPLNFFSASFDAGVYLANSGNTDADFRAKEEGTAESYAVFFRPTFNTRTLLLNAGYTPHSLDGAYFFGSILPGGNGIWRSLDLDAVFSGFSANDLLFDAIRLEPIPGGNTTHATTGPDISGIEALTVCSALDTDGDLTPDHLDLDSDNDGCPDAIEGGGAYLLSDLANNRITAAVDTDGVPNNGGSQALGSSIDPAVVICCDATASGYPDADGDNVADNCDLDDDNDGILDEDEGVEFLLLDLSGVADGNRDFSNRNLACGANYSGMATAATTAVPTGLRGFANGVLRFSNGNAPSFGTDNTTYTITFDAPVQVRFSQAQFVLFENTEEWSISSNTGTFSVNAPIIADPVLPGGMGAELSNVTGNGTGAVVFNPSAIGNNVAAANTEWSITSSFVTDITITYKNSTLIGNLGSIRISANCFTDTDGDGTADYLDLDSDNDGCPDAIEGGGAYVLSDLANDTITGGVDANGVTLNPKGTQTPDASIVASTIVCCDAALSGYPDANGDNLTDFCDEDNDGIVDTDEGPGGVTNGLSLWLKANKGAGTVIDGSKVPYWLDNSPFADTAVNIDLLDSTTYTKNVLNYNPGVFWDNSVANTTGFSLRKRYIFSPAANMGMDIMFVSAPSATGDRKFLYDFGGFANEDVALFQSNSITGLAYSGRSDNTPLVLNPAGKSTLSHLNIDFGTPATVNVNGNLELTGIGNTWTEITSNEIGVNNVGGSSSGPVTIGRQSKNDNIDDNGGRRFFGQMGEGIAFNMALTPQEIARVNSYLAIKYGITLDQTTPQNYVNSWGDVTWTNDGDGYDTDIFGIGLDNRTDMDQRVSKSVNDGTSLIISLDSDLDTTNESLTRTEGFLTDTAFMVLASNGAANTFADISPYKGHQVLQEQWKVDQTSGDMDSVYIGFKSEDLALHPYRVGLFLLVNSATRGDLLSVPEKLYPMTYNPAKDDYYVKVKLEHGDYLTIGSVKQTIRMRNGKYWVFGKRIDILDTNLD